MNAKRVAAGVSLVMLCAVPVMFGDDDRDNRDHELHNKHVLLISIDGMHAVDFENCKANNTCPTLKALGEKGVNYARTSASRPSDSFPGLTALVTGGTPKATGVWYDVAYDRVLAPPAADTGNGLLHGDCVPGKINGTSTEYEEGVDIDQTQLSGGSPAYTNPIDGGFLSIDPNKLPRDPFNGCKPVYPWNFIRTNTIDGVIHKAGGFTAWADKHAVYASVSGPTGTSSPSNVDDYYAPDINSSVIDIPGLKTPTGFDCHTLSTSIADWTSDFDAVKCNDQLKVNAVLNQINGRNHLGTAKAPVPVIFGMNFQAVSVGQKLLTAAANGGYTDATGTPTPKMLGEIEYVDAAIGQMVDALRTAGMMESTTLIVTAKHGQSPIDPKRFFPIPGHSKNNGTPPSAVLGANFLPDSELNQIGPTEDDISLLWLKPGADLPNAVNLLEAAGPSAGIGQIFFGSYLETIYDKPGLPPNDPRTPDIIVQPNVGVVYTGSLKKQAEHGGFAQDDTNVMLLVSNPHLKPATVTSFVETTQVAPTILAILGMNPASLDAVKEEGTPVLPGLN